MSRDNLWPPERALELKRLVEVEGLTSYQVAEALGLTRTQVCSKAQRMSLHWRRAPGESDRNLASRERAWGVIVEDDPLDEPLPAAPDSRPRPWLERGAGECVWPLSAPGHQMLVCCAPRESPLKPYCAWHNARAFIAPVTTRLNPNSPPPPWAMRMRMLDTSNIIEADADDRLDHLAEVASAEPRKPKRT